jgi:hypothetical protein
VISGELSFRILYINGLRKHPLDLISVSISSVSSIVGASDVVDFTDIMDVGR